MNQHVRRWGNSAAVRLPASALAAAGFKPDDPVDIRAEPGRIVIEKAKAKKELDKLIEGITPDNRHDEIDWGRPAGREFW
jgi:antitoxin MazE